MNKPGNIITEETRILVRVYDTARHSESVQTEKIVSQSGIIVAQVASRGA